MNNRVGQMNVRFDSKPPGKFEPKTPVLTSVRPPMVKMEQKTPVQMPAKPPTPGATAPSPKPSPSAGGDGEKDLKSSQSPANTQQIQQNRGNGQQSQQNRVNRFGNAQSDRAPGNSNFANPNQAGPQTGGGIKRDFKTMQQANVHSEVGSANAGPAEPSDDQSLHKEKKFSGRCRLFVGNLPNDMSEADFKKLFEQFGEYSEVFLNSSRGFGFIRFDTRHHAEDARSAIDGKVVRGRPLRVRFAAHGAALRVRYLAPHVSNEMLAEAFSVFGDVERAVVCVDDRGKSTGEGIVEFTRKPAAMTALKRISEGVFLMTSNPRPVAAELLEQTDENDGLPDVFIQKSAEVMKEREQPPRFAQPGSFEYEFGLKWKTLYQLLHEQQEALKKNFEEEVVKMEMDMEAAMLEQQTVLLRQDLIRRQEELRRLEEQTQLEIQRRLEARRQDDERRRQQSMDSFDIRRSEENMWRQQNSSEDDVFKGQAITAAQQISKLIPQMMQQPPQRSRFEHPPQGLSGPGGNMGPGGPGMDNPRMGGQTGGRDDYFDSKRMRRY